MSAPRANPAALVIGASGGIGGAVLAHFLRDDACDRVIGVSRGERPGWADDAGDRLLWFQCDYGQEAIAGVVAALDGRPLDIRRVVICNGLLHDDRLSPEKALEQVGRDTLLQSLEGNLVVPALWVSALVGQLRGSSACVLAALSARVGSIADNRLGGWYGYRSSKAALNMFLRTAAVEYARRAPRVKLLAFHPGTTDTPLSAPFQKNVPADKLFTPQEVARRLAQVMDAAPCDGELSFIDWAGKPVAW